MIPVPFSNWFQCVRALAPFDLSSVAIMAMEVACDPSRITPPWIGVEPALMSYGIAACREVEARDALEGIARQEVATTVVMIANRLEELGEPGRRFLHTGGVDRPHGVVPSYVLRFQVPSWCGVEELHVRHRNALLGKRPTWYRKLHWREQMQLVSDETDFALPPHDPKAPVVRWLFDTSNPEWDEGR